MAAEHEYDVYDEMLTGAFDIFESQPDGRIFRSETDGSYAHMIMVACRVERFVDDAVSTSSLAFKPDESRGRKIVVVNDRLAGFNKFLGGIADDLPSEYAYSANVDLFMDCYLKLGLNRMPVPILSPNELVFGRPEFELLNELIRMIRTKSEDPEHKLRKKNLRDRSNKRMRSAMKLVRRLFEKYNKLLVLRIDLSYRKELKDSITPEVAKSDLSRLLNNTRTNRTLFEFLVGYIWKLEYGQDKGYHYHAIMFFNGSDVRNDYYRAMLIGEYWNNVITKGRGTYFNCNAKKHEYQHIGIGMVRRNDFLTRDNLRNRVIKYLAKSEQYLRAKRLGRNRCFGIGSP